MPNPKADAKTIKLMKSRERILTRQAREHLLAGRTELYKEAIGDRDATSSWIRAYS